MFTHDMEEKLNGRIDIIDLDGDTVYDMIIYIYSGKVAELDGKATGLLSAAEKYDLKVCCHKYFSNHYYIFKYFRDLYTKV